MEPIQNTKRSYGLNLLFVIALLGLLALLAACENSGRPSTGPSPVALLSRSLIIPVTDSMHVRDSTWQRMSTAFDDHFKLGSGTAIQQAEQELLWEDLSDLVPKGTGNLHGLRFDYGLHGDSMLFGISVLQLDSTSDPEVFEYSLPDSLYVVGKGKPVPQDARNWRDAYQYATTDPAVYFSRVRVQRKAGDPFTALDHDVDVQADIMPWDDELLPLYTDNVVGHADSVFFAVLRCVSTADENGEYRHGLCIHLRLRPADKLDGPYRDLLDNAYDKDHPFLLKGADFGNMCPPGCADYRRPPR